MGALFAHYDPEIVWDQTHYGGAELAAVYHGHDGIRRFFGEWLAPFESYYAHAEEIVDAGDAVLVRCRQGGRGKHSGIDVEMPAYWQVYRLRDGRIVRIEVYVKDADALKAVGLEAPPEESDVVRLTRAFCEVGGNVDQEMRFYGPNPVYDLSAMGIGIFDGRAAIRTFLEGWMASYDGYEEAIQEIRDLGGGIAFASVRESARPLGSNAQARVQSVYGFVIEWIDGKIARLTAYPDTEEALAAAKRLAESQD